LPTSPLLFFLPFTSSDFLGPFQKYYLLVFGSPPSSLTDSNSSPLFPPQSLLFLCCPAARTKVSLPPLLSFHSSADRRHDSVLFSFFIFGLLSHTYGGIVSLRQFFFFPPPLLASLTEKFHRLGLLFPFSFPSEPIFWLLHSAGRGKPDRSFFLLLFRAQDWNISFPPPQCFFIISLFLRPRLPSLRVKKSSRGPLLFFFLPSSPYSIIEADPCSPFFFLPFFFPLPFFSPSPRDIVFAK